MINTKFYQNGIIKCAIFALTAVFAFASVWPAGAYAADTASTVKATGAAKAASTAKAAGGTPDYQEIIETESAWIASLQLSNGALPMTSFKDAVTDSSDSDNDAASSGQAETYENPYFSEFAILALLENGTRYSAEVKKYLDWHFAHINAKSEDVNGEAGTIYDYTEYADENGNVTAEKVVTKEGRKFYDSTDSYAALFLCDLYKYYRVTNDREYIEANKAQIDLVVSAMFCTMNKGLPMATPSYHTKYLMDNAEVCRGMRDGAKLYSEVFPGDSRINKMTKARKTIKNRIENKMWNKKAGAYYSALTKKEKPYSFRWNRFYMDATAQVYPITNGVKSPESKRAKAVYSKFNKYWSSGKKNHDWEQLQTTDKDGYYWGELVYCAALMNDTARVETYMRTYEAAVRKTDHAYPLYNADSAKVVLAAGVMLK